MAMPMAPRKNTNTHQSALEKPCIRPYHGTRIAAAAKVSANISALVQISGGRGSFSARSDMRALQGPLKEGAVTYHAPGRKVGLASFLPGCPVAGALFSGSQCPTASEFYHYAGSPDDLARAQIRVPDAACAGTVVRPDRAAVVAHEAGRGPGVAERRRHAAAAAPVGDIRMPEGGLGPPGNPVLGHVLEIQLHVPLVELLPRVLGEVGGARKIGRASC